MPQHPLPFPGFTAISDRVYLRDGHEKAGPNPPDEPTTVVIFGWGDGLPKNVSKYADGYNKLFPNARIIVILSKTLHASNQQEEARIQAMLPVIDLIFPTPTGDGGREQERVLLHAMSNTGGIFVAAAVAAYQRRHGADRQFPHKLLVCDSTPGSLDFASQVGRWSRAMAVGTAKFFPWPFVVTHGLWYAFLWANWALEWVRGSEPPGVWATRVMLDQSIATIEAPRLYLYSKEDEIIWWEDLEQAVARVRALGWKTDLEMFEGSPHVGHMRLHPEQYWNKIGGCWRLALEGSGDGHEVFL